METVKGYPFGKGNPRHVFTLRIIGIATVAHSQGVINGKMQSIDISAHLNSRSKRVLYGIRMGLTIIGEQTSIILDIQIRKGAVDMGAHFLPCFGRPKHPNDWNSGFLIQLRLVYIVAKLRVIFRRDSLIMVYAVQPHAKDVHGGLYMIVPMRFESPWGIPRRSSMSSVRGNSITYKK